MLFLYPVWKMNVSEHVTASTKRRRCGSTSGASNSDEVLLIDKALQSLMDGKKYVQEADLTREQLLQVT
jgi:hypothetical protein